MTLGDRDAADLSWSHAGLPMYNSPMRRCTLHAAPARCTLLLVAGLSMLAEPAGGQVLEARQPRLLDQWVFSAGLFGGIPLGDFHKNEDGGGGFELMLGFQPFRRQPLLLRTHVATLMYGRVTATGYQDVCDIFGCTTEEVEYTARTHTMTSWHTGPEFFAIDGSIRPYGFALAGITWFHSSANEPPTTPGGPSTGSVSLFSSHNFSTAYTLGTRFVRSKFGREYGLDLGARVTRNAKANYLTDGGVRFYADGSMAVVPIQTAAHVFSIHVGFFMGPYINWNERRPR